MSYALRQQHGLPGELKREHALFSGIGAPKVEINNIMFDRVHDRNDLRECAVPDQQLPTFFPHKTTSTRSSKANTSRPSHESNPFGMARLKAVIGLPLRA